MNRGEPGSEDLRAECAALRLSLEEAQQTLGAIRNGEVDALVVSGAGGEKVYTLTNAAEPYRILVEEMNEGAVTLGTDGSILYCNQHFASLLQSSARHVMGANLRWFVLPEDVATFDALLQTAMQGRTTGEITLRTTTGALLPTKVALNRLSTDSPAAVCALFTDLTERKNKETALLNLMEDLADSKSRLEGANRDLQQEMEERRRADEALRRSLSRIRGFVDANIVGVIIATADGAIKEANDYYLRTIGYTREEFEAGRVNWRRLTPPEWLAADENALRELRETGRCAAYEKEYQKRDGTRVPVLLADAMLPGAQQEIAAFVLDLTARKRAERELQQLNATLEERVVERTEELRRSEERFRAITANTPDHVLVQDRQLRYTLVVNPQLGLSEPEMLGKTDHEVLAKEDADRLMAIKRTVLETGASYSLETSMLNRTGDREHFEGAYVPKRGPDGTVDGLIGYFRNVTARKRADAALRDSQQRLELALQVGRAFAFEWDITRDEVIRSPHCADILGLAGDATRESGRAFFQRVHPDDRPQFERTVTTLTPTQPRYSLEYRIVRPDGGVAVVHESAVGAFDAGSRLIRVTGMAADITASRMAEDELRKMATELQATNQELESFCYSVSHDLRAPLRSIDGFSRIVLRDCAARLDEKHCEHLMRVRQASQRMGELIDDLLELSRTTRANLHWVEVDLSAMVQSAIDDLQQVDPERRVAVQVESGLSVTADPILLRSAVENLLGNAWKFTAGREGARIEFGAGEKDGERFFFVRDNGVGFDMANAGKLFGVFQRMHSSRDFPGTGIGLATVQRIVQRHGGRVWADAAVNGGATFAFTLGSGSKLS